MIRAILTSLIFVNSFFAVSFDGLQGGSVVPTRSVKLDAKMRGLQINMSELNHLHGLDHSYKHLEICSPKMGKRFKSCLRTSLQLFKFNANTQQARQATIDLAEQIMNNPIEVRSGIKGIKDGKLYKGYLGRYKGQLIEIRITEIAAGKKDLPGKLKTIVGLRQADWMRKYPSSYNNLLSQVRKAPLLNVGGKKITKPVVPKVVAPRVRNPLKGVGAKLGGIAGAVIIDCVISGGITVLMGGNPIEGCVDGLTMTTGQRYIPVLEMGAERSMQPHPEMNKVKVLNSDGEEYRFGFIDSLVDPYNMKIINGPYKDQCLAVKDDIYWTAVECETLRDQK